MCYVVAKHVDRIGCVAIRMQPGETVVALKREVKNRFGYEKIQMVTISRPSAYGEYAPYHFTDSEEEFKDEIGKLV